jgi:ABC-2 type transport system permease protein
MRTILHIIRKEFLQISRDRPMMAILFIMPIIQLLILGYAVSSEVRNVRMVVCDLDRSAMSGDLTDRFMHSRYFRVRILEKDARPGRIIDEGRASVAVTIPAGFAENWHRSMPSRIQVLMDGQDSNTSTVALGYINGILENVLQEKLASSAGMPGVPEPRLITPVVRIWYNEDLKASHFMVPGIVVFLLTMVTSLVSAMGLVREKEIGTLEQLLVSPVKKHQLMIGKIVPFSVLGFIELGLGLGFAKAWYHIPMVGNLGLFGLFTLIYLFTTLGIGLLISAAAQTQQQAMFMTVFVLFFFIIMSGFIFPLENMPRVMRVLSYLNPMRYMIISTREIFIKGATVHSLYGQGIALTVFGGIIFSFAVRRFQGRMG